MKYTDEYKDKIKYRHNKKNLTIIEKNILGFLYGVCFDMSNPFALDTHFELNTNRKTVIVKCGNTTIKTDYDGDYSYLLYNITTIFPIP